MILSPKLHLRVLLSAGASLCVFLASGCGQRLPDHKVETNPLAMHSGMRVQITVNQEITKDQCIALIERYRSRGSPDGQVSVRKPSVKLDGAPSPWCVDNFDGRGVFFNDDYLFVP